MRRLIREEVWAEGVTLWFRLLCFWPWPAVGRPRTRPPPKNRAACHGSTPPRLRTTGWRRRWRAIMSAGHGQDYKPTQYVHLYWFNREKGLLGIQYWFYYPYNEWINHHEGDWERINVILRGPTRLTENATFRPAGYQF